MGLRGQRLDRVQQVLGDLELTFGYSLLESGENSVIEAVRLPSRSASVTAHLFRMQPPLGGRSSPLPAVSSRHYGLLYGYGCLALR